MQLRGASALMIVAASAAQAEVRFAPVDVVEHVYDGGWEFYVGGGVAAFDCSGDGLPELVAAGGENPPVLLRNKSSHGGTITFEEATPDALMVPGTTGFYPLDIDGDGLLDLVGLRVGENLLLKGGAECNFEPMDVPGFDGSTAWTTAFSATWERQDAPPTLAFGNYVDRDDPKGPFEACDGNDLFRPVAEGYAHTALTPGFCPLSILFSDWGRLGRADLRMSNDRHYYVKGGAEQLWAMEDTPRLYGEADGWATHMLWGMGIAQRDLDFDGKAEVFLSSMGDQRLMKRVSAESPTFEDVPYEMGTSAHRPYTGGDGRPSTGWHISFGDVDNDGLDDVFISKGNVQQMPGAAMEDPNNLLMQQGDGTFAEKGDVAGIATLARSRGAALVDLNHDGLLDLAVVNRRAPMEVYQNVSEGTGTWVALTLMGKDANSQAVGAFIEVKVGKRVYLREITVGGGHAGGVSAPQYFGLGEAELVEVRIKWPDGTQGDWIEVPVNGSWRVWSEGPVTVLSEY
ncbi:CRTAC1 family protein [Shimia sagamensis]|uniref:Repeat domain-containing protein n=1 Tax=Shimia sagamensis TaxID=1566352 RepID=A0ABY1NZV1_9RHOB|nr:CRTAC1 family protein [Shimia sagamensis]SMP22951.1 Repeat domain-containing protein [Shimia sagamensis]